MKFNWNIWKNFLYLQMMKEKTIMALERLKVYNDLVRIYGTRYK